MKNQINHDYIEEVVMGKHAIGYVATVFYNGEKTKFRYVGNGEWEFISGCNSPARYEQLIQMVN